MSVDLFVCCTSFSLSVCMQMFPMALVCGNTYVIKPSEQDPGACMELVRMAQQAGVPDGVVNVIHGTKDGKCVSCKLPLLIFVYYSR